LNAGPGPGFLNSGQTALGLAAADSPDFFASAGFAEAFDLGLAAAGRAGFAMAADILFLPGLEISLIPAATLEAETRRRNQAVQLGFAAFRTLPQRRIRSCAGFFQARARRQLHRYS